MNAPETKPHSLGFFFLSALLLFPHLGARLKAYRNYKIMYILFELRHCNQTSFYSGDPFAIRFEMEQQISLNNAQNDHYRRRNQRKHEKLVQ